MIGRHIRSNVSALWKLRAPKKSRTFKANVRKATLMHEGKLTRMDVCTRCLRTMSKTDA